MRKMPPPKIPESISKMHRELVKRAAIEHTEPDTSLPRLDQDPIDAATTYLHTQGAPNTVAGTIPPGKAQRIRLNMPEPSNANPTAVLAMALGSLGVYQRVCGTIAACERIRQGAEAALAGLSEVTKGLSELMPRGTDQELSPLPCELDAAKILVEVAPIVTRFNGLVATIARLYQNRDFWRRDPDIRARLQIQDCRRRLMTAFTDREIALMVDDGQGGTIGDQTDRVRSQRRPSATPSICSALP